MSTYARGARAWGECGRCGMRSLLKNLMEDGYIRGLLVHPGCYEPEHPQDRPIRVADAVALHKPAPELSKPPDEGTPAPALAFDSLGKLI